MSEIKPGGGYTAVIGRDGDWWRGSVVEVAGVNAQEKSREKLLESLRLALGEAIQMNGDLARRSAVAGATEVEIIP